MRADPHLLGGFRETACALDRDEKAETNGTNEGRPTLAQAAARPAPADQKGVTLGYKDNKEIAKETKSDKTNDDGPTSATTSRMPCTFSHILLSYN